MTGCTPISTLYVRLCMYIRKSHVETILECFVCLQTPPSLPLLPGLPPDCEVSVWHISPHASGDALSQVMRVKADGEPSLVCQSSQRLCIAVNDHISATYSITLYGLKERSEDRGYHSTPMAHVEDSPLHIDYVEMYTLQLSAVDTLIQWQRLM